ncbi:DNA polymerase III subunit alpha [Euzebya sp.]|uniref:DNA polymerase III subunit alpha n=1 Tax=Euzebya sp. TaxID=1971409 RepID=UPI003513B7D1
MGVTARRKDTTSMPSAAPAVTHLATRTCYSLRDGVIRPRELAEAAARAGMEAVGIADRGGLYGAVRFAQACGQAGVRPIYGADLALFPEADDRGRVREGWGITRASRSGIGRVMGPGSGQAWLEDDAARVTLIAADDRGFATLARTITDHHLESERSDPHLRWAQVVHRLGGADPGVFALLGAESPVGRLLAAGRVDAARAETRRWLHLLGPERLLIGVTHHLAPGDDDVARRTFALADDLGVRAVAHQAARYLTPADARIADVMDAVRQQVPLARHHRTRRNAEGHFKDAAAMARVFAERPDALVNTMWVAERCGVDIGLGRLRVPDFVTGPGREEGSDPAWALAELRRRCEHGLHERFARVEATHTHLLDRELDMVRTLGLAPYFLTVAEIVQRIRDKGILAACRGSAAGSIVTYALRISDVDPVAHDLAFERFMNPYRDELPDIDIDVESARREDIYRDLLGTYGEDRVACVAMVETFKARMAIREVGKAMGMPAAEVDYIAKSFPHVGAGDVRPALAHLPELEGLNLEAAHRRDGSRSQYSLLLDVVERLDGFPRHIALHPCGILLADRTLRDIAPMERSAAGFAMAQYDKDDVEALGLCKLDVLGVRMLSSMAHCTEQVRRTRGVDVDFDAVGWADPDTYELIQSTRTLGMFQIESPGQRELIGKFQPEHLDDLVVDISLFRPGPVKGDMIKPFLRRRHRQEATGVPHPILERALGETYGVIVYHEQVMRAVAAVTGCDLAEADLVRRRLGDPTQVGELERWITSGAAERGLPVEVADWLWHALSQFASFGFCKAHAAAFSVPTYRSAWLKAHYLPEFMAGVLTHDPGMYPRRLILEDARQFGVAILPLDVNASARDYTVEVVPADEAYALLGIADPSALLGVGDPAARLPSGWRRAADGTPLPPAGFDKGTADVPGWRYAIRLGLQDVERIDDDMIDSLLLGRPFTSVADLRLRARLSQPVAESLTHAGALDGIGGVGVGVGAVGEGRGRTRRDLLLEVAERWSGLTRHKVRGPDQPEQLGLLEPEEAAGLPEYRPAERVRAELEVVGLDASRHVISFYDSLLDRLGVTRAADLLDCREGQLVRIGGVKVATQTPPVKSGQRVIFLSLDDATGVGDATFFESVHDACAWTVFHTWLLVAEGRVHRSGRRGVSITASRAWDLRRLMTAWREGWLDEALGEGGRPTDQAARDFSDGAPSEGIRGAAGRSGLTFAHRPGEHPQMRRTIPFGGAGPAEPVGRPTRFTPNGTTWADPAGRNGGLDPQDSTRLSPNDPRHPDHRHVRRCTLPGCPSHDPAGGDAHGPGRKLWHSSPGSAGR